MSTNKTAVELIQVLDAEGKVTNYEVEYLVVYTGNDPDIARSFKPSRTRESVTADEFNAFEAASGVAVAAALQDLNDKNAALQDLNAELVNRTHAAEDAFNALRESEPLLNAEAARDVAVARAVAAEERITLLDEAVSKASRVLDNVSAMLRERDATIAALTRLLTEAPAADGAG